MSFLRTRVFAILIALLTMGSYGYELYTHAMPTHEIEAEHQHSSSEETGDCHHCICHCSPVMLVSFDRTIPFQVPAFKGYVVAQGEDAPETVPVGIDHPPQLA